MPTPKKSPVAGERTQHTPGPWILRDFGDYVCVEASDERKTIAQVSIGRGSAITTANARLIAAAPELLEACKIMVEAFNGCTCTDEHKSEGVPCPWCMGADAIAKAEKGAL